MDLRLDICAYDSPGAVTGPASWFQRVPVLLQRAGFQLRVHLFWWESEHAGTLRRYLLEHEIVFTSHRFGTSDENVRNLLLAVTQDPPAVLIADNVIPALLATRWLKSWGIRTVGILRSDDGFYHGVLDRFVGGRGCDRLDVIVSVSEFLTAQAQQRASGAVRCETIPSGAPLPSHAATRRRDRWQIVYSGRLVQEQKRILETALCLAEVVRRFPVVHAVIAGTGPESAAVAKIATESGGRLELREHLGEQQIQELLAESHAILLLSDYEGTPSAIMEAMAHGVVPICLNIRSGIPELVLHGQTGLLVTDRWESTFDAVGQLLEDASLFCRLSEAARQRIADRFSTQVSVGRWISLLRSLTVAMVPQRTRRLPVRLNLPRVHPGYHHQDVRGPGRRAVFLLSLMWCLRRCRLVLGRWRRMILKMAGLQGRDHV